MLVQIINLQRIVCVCVCVTESYSKSFTYVLFCPWSSFSTLSIYLLASTFLLTACPYDLVIDLSLS